MARKLFSYPGAASSALLLVAILLTVVLFSSPHLARSTTTPTGVTGYAWSDTIGWISLDCHTGGPTGNDVCATSGNYHLAIASDGTVSGYAWSDNIGWVSANSADIATCASGATSNISNGAWTGWLRAIGGGVPANPQNGGWDGCISMKDTNASPRWAVTYDQVTGVFAPCSGGSSCAWGSDVVGWTDLSKAQVTLGACSQSCSCSGSTLICTCPSSSNTCVSPTLCPVGGNACVAPNGWIKANPGIVTKNARTSITWSAGVMKSGTSCTVTSDANSDSWNSLVDGAGNTAGGPQQSSQIQKQTTYTLQCTAADNSPFQTTVLVNLAPGFIEQ